MDNQQTIQIKISKSDLNKKLDKTSIVTLPFDYHLPDPNKVLYVYFERDQADEIHVLSAEACLKTECKEAPLGEIHQRTGESLLPERIKIVWEE
jgi:hypothetical protein